MILYACEDDDEEIYYVFKLEKAKEIANGNMIMKFEIDNLPLRFLELLNDGAFDGVGEIIQGVGDGRS